MTFRMHFMLGALAAIACVLLAQEQQTVLGEIATTGFQSGGVFAYIIAFLIFLKWAESDVLRDRAPPQSREAYQVAAFISPLAVMWMCIYLYTAHTSEHIRLKMVPYVLFGIPLVVVSIGCIVGIIDGYETLMGKKSGVADPPQAVKSMFRPLAIVGMIVIAGGMFMK